MLQINFFFHSEIWFIILIKRYSTLLHLQCSHLVSHPFWSSHTTLAGQGAGSPEQRGRWLSLHRLLQQAFQVHKVQKMPRAALWFCPYLENCMSLSKQTRSAPQKNSCSCTAILLPPGCLGGHSLTKWFLLCLFTNLLVPVRGISTAVSSERLACSHIPRGARCGCVPSKAHVWPPPQGQTDTSVSPAQPAQAARVPLQPCWVQWRGSAQGTAAIWQNSEPGPNLHACTFQTYPRLWLTCPTCGAWQQWLCNLQSPICRRREKLSLRSLSGRATQSWLLKTEL